VYSQKRGRGVLEHPAAHLRATRNRQKPDSLAAYSSTFRDVCLLFKRTVALGVIIGVVFVGLPALILWVYDTRPLTLGALALVAGVTYFLVKYAQYRGAP